MLLPTINPFYMQSTIWKVIIPNQNKKQCSAAFKSALHQVNNNQKKLGNKKHISPVSLKCLDSLKSRSWYYFLWQDTYYPNIPPLSPPRSINK